jgi:hypothetical protein
MNDVAWTDLTPAEQRAIAVLGSGMSVEICDAAALRTLRRDGLVRGSRLTELGEQLRQAAILQTLVN